MAASWFALRGYDVSWPLEPARYDLLVSARDAMWRVQAKTTTHRAGSGWTVSLSTNGRGQLTYGPDEIDYFFVVDDDLACYLIPIAAVGGLRAISLAAYERYRVPDLGPRSDAVRAHSRVVQRREPTDEADGEGPVTWSEVGENLGDG